MHDLLMVKIDQKDPNLTQQTRIGLCTWSAVASGSKTMSKF